MMYFRIICLFFLIGLNPNLYAQNLLQEMTILDISENSDIRNNILRRADAALLVIRSNIPDLTMESNNKLIRTERPGNGVTYLILVPGTHLISFSAPNFIRATRRIFLSPRDVIGWSVKELESQPDLNNTIDAVLSLVSNPPGAEITLNGELIGQTPLRDYRLTPGQYQILLRRDGYQDYLSQLRMRSGDQNTINAQMAPLLQSESNRTPLIWGLIAGVGALAGLLLL